MRYLVFSIITICLLSSCWNIKKGEPIEGVAPGTWRAIFKLGRQNVPILYEVKNSNNEKPLQLSFNTGEQKVISDTAYLFGDTLFAHFEKAQTKLKVVYQIDQMNGYLYDQKRQFYPIEFSGIKGPRHRFPNIRSKPIIELTGEWSMIANVKEDSSTTATLRLIAMDNKVAGTIYRKNGQSYPLEGTVQGAKLYLSGFDGKHVVWINANIKDNQHLDEGSFRVNEESFFWKATRKAGVSEVK